ncbi:MAG: hypothetical protein LCH69_17275 [Proteobacteria bacterium]|nr:hypothetical protein [Pseudomonadota bacterium]
MKKIAFLLIIGLLGACAKAPDKIAAADLGNGAYSGHSCNQLSAENLQISQDLANLSAKQKSAAEGDAWGVFLLGLPLSSMSGNDQEALIAVAKGKVQAIDREKARKGCK